MFWKYYGSLIDIVDYLEVYVLKKLSFYDFICYILFCGSREYRKIVWGFLGLFWELSVGNSSVGNFFFC